MDTPPETSQGHWIETPLGRLHTGIDSTPITADKLKVGDWLFDAAPARASYVGVVYEAISTSTADPVTRFHVRWRKWDAEAYYDIIHSNSTELVYLVKEKPRDE